MQFKSVQNRVCRLLLGRKMVQKSAQNRLSNVLVYVNRAPGSVKNRVYILLLGRSIVQKSAQIVRSGDPATGFAERLGHSRPAIICFFVWPHLAILFFFVPRRSCYNIHFRPESRLTIIAAPPPLQKRTPFASSNNRHCPLLLERPKNDTFQGPSGIICVRRVNL